ncbi:hypothetical protein ACQP2P_39575 [Dactylosporangium sp. CA-139114]|uniref:hypothetical protein n=1 Tax=Dactylosporangium sp. CA-139114 TaxID=3239931 RepID=UPI003D97C4BE
MRSFVDVNHRAALAPARGFPPRSEPAVKLRQLSIRMLPYLPGKGLMIAAMTRETRRAAGVLRRPAAIS